MFGRIFGGKEETSIFLGWKNLLGYEIKKPAGGFFP